MGTRRVALGLFTVALLVFPALAGETIKTMEQARQAAAAGGKLILVDGTADW